MHLVARGHSRSRDKDGDHTIRSAVVDNHMLPANFMALCFIERELLPIECLHYGNRDFSPLCSCDLDLDPITFKYTLDPYLLEIYPMSENVLLRQFFRKISYYKHTYNYRQIGLYRYYRNSYIYAPPELCTTLHGWSKIYRLKWCYCNKMLSYRRETALQGILVLAESGRLELPTR